MKLTKNDYKLFLKAREIAISSTYPKFHVGCIAVYHGVVIASGINSSKTHPIQFFYNRYRDCSDPTLPPTLHAEIDCINQLKHLNINFSKVKLYIYRSRVSRPFGMTRPCPSCIEAIKDIGIRDIYYTTDDGYVYERLGDVKRWA